jgi:hypothetical protein
MLTRPALLGLLVAALSAAAPLRADEPKIVRRVAGFDVDVIGDLQGFGLDLTPQRLADGLDIVALRLTSGQARRPPRLTLKWSIPSRRGSARRMSLGRVPTRPGCSCPRGRRG